LRLTVRGVVQGVGFRPFVHRLASGLGLAGWVNNSNEGVQLEVEGPTQAVESFRLRLELEKPPRSVIHGVESSWLSPAGYRVFAIVSSESGGEKGALVPPDIATCPDCLRDIFAPDNRRFRYPFTACAHCGPRFTVVESLPYDRANTSMRHFALCPACQAEFDNPSDRRFHAQTNACPVCGPRLELWQRDGKIPGSGDSALASAARAIRAGKIVALKGLGGFHLIVLASDDFAVRRLRELKQREEKPFAVMFPSISAARVECEISPLEERLLESPAAPIVLLRRGPAPSSLSPEIAPRHPCLGAMLPSTPLHHLLMADLAVPVVATSGNLKDETVCVDERDALRRLAGVADLFLVHDRPIIRALDDSVVRVMAGREMVLRRARGYAPLPVTLPADIQVPGILAVGAHQKNTVALAAGRQVFLSQHIGDLENVVTYEAFLRAITDLPKLFDARPSIIASDAHPDYLSSQFAAELVERNPTLRGIRVQHHGAHVLACMAENELEPPVLGVAWDGSGHGLDGTIWGGEFLLVTASSIERRAHPRPFPLPGAEQAVREPRRVALALLREVFGDAAFDPASSPADFGFSASEINALKTMLEKGLNSPPTSSVGRLFDGVAALAGMRQTVSYEGQAAVELELALDGITTDDAYCFRIPKLDESGDAPLIIDWRPIIEGVVADMKCRAPAGVISAKFHNSLVEAIIAIARRNGELRVALTGGCFQNRYLLERAIRRLGEEGFRAYWHQHVPPNDGGIALGQILAAVRSKT
jgi:hydrogenase maturation protein HypF